MAGFEPIKLPENYKGSFDLEAMLPGDTAFIYAHSLRAEINTGGLYLNKDTEITDDFINPSYLPEGKPSDRVGIVKVYQEIGGEPVEGFIADITDVKPGSVKSEKLFPVPDDEGKFDGSYLVSQQNKWSQVLGLRYRDAEGNIQFVGPEWLQDSASYLAEVFEAKKTKSVISPREASMPGVELLKVEEVEPNDNPIINADDSKSGQETEEPIQLAFDMSVHKDNQ